MITKILFQTSAAKPEKYVVDQLMVFLNSDWKYIHFDDQEAIDFLGRNRVDEFPSIVDKFHEMPSGAHRADLFRYYFLYLNGGVFVDTDAMLKMSIEKITGNYDFFSVKSAIGKCIFQGFIGCSRRHEIIYRALKNAYEMDPRDLVSNFHLLCYNLYTYIEDHFAKPNIKLYEEQGFDDDTVKTVNDTNDIILLHYWRRKIIPREMDPGFGTS